MGGTTPHQGVEPLRPAGRVHHFAIPHEHDGIVGTGLNQHTTTLHLGGGVGGWSRRRVVQIEGEQRDVHLVIAHYLGNVLLDGRKTGRESFDGTDVEERVGIAAHLGIGL